MASIALVTVPTAAEPSRVRGIWRELRNDKLALLAVAFLVLLLTSSVFAPLFAPHDPSAQSLSTRLVPPAWTDGGTWTHPLGTDNLGRDVLSRVIYGSRASLIVGGAVVLFAGTVGVGLGLLAGYKGGRIGRVIMRVVDLQVAFPGLLLAMVILAVVGPSLRAIVVVLAINGWMVYARMTRGIVLATRQLTYVEAAELVGCRPRRVIFRHIVPNLASPLTTMAVLEFARIILAEAGLSFLGLGIQPPATSWGLDVANGRDFIFGSWWLVTFPGIAIALTVLAVNLVASWLRVVADPLEREKRFALANSAGTGTA